MTARAIASGGIASFDGDIWFGTLITVGIPALAWIEAYGIPLPPTDDKITEIILGTYRPLTLFRGRFVEGDGRHGPSRSRSSTGTTELPVYQLLPR